MVKSNIDENTVVSPLSIAGALHMLAAGSRANTRAEILKVLGIKEPESCEKGQKHLVTQYNYFLNQINGGEKSENFPVFNGMYVNEPLGGLRDDGASNPMYIDILSKNYVGKLGEIKYLDFKSSPEVQQDYINNQISEATNGLIPDLVSGLDSDTLSVIVSAIYYEREWHKDLSFRYLPKSQTSDFSQFCFAKDTSSPCQANVQWMKTTTDRYNQIKHREVNVDGVRMNVFVLPQKAADKATFNLNIFQPIDDDLSVLDDKNTEFFNQAMKEAMLGYDSAKHEVGVLMPEFRVNWKDSLNRALGNLGIVSAFDPNEADLKFMLPNAERAFVKKVLHQADFRVSKTGIKAAAATSIEISNRSGSMSTITKTLDSPFVFMLTGYEGSNTSEDLSMGLHLFMGAVTEIEPVPVED